MNRNRILENNKLILLLNNKICKKQFYFKQLIPVLYIIVFYTIYQNTKYNNNNIPSNLNFIKNIQKIIQYNKFPFFSYCYISIP